ncbi:lantibiotic dehydratase [Streptomyces sp. NPDC051104]|uniref:lantibiotic dehydratase n=1 Tax=Streptomyces sp. NPDC051104 TaxID=3155044 RepID=UPI00343C1EBD
MNYLRTLQLFTGEARTGIRHERQALAVLCADGHFASSVDIVSGDLGRAVRRYAEHGGEVDRADRKSEARIAAYALRAMTRTSPRARFTAVSLGLMDAADATQEAVRGWEAEAPAVVARAVEVQRGALLVATQPDTDAPDHVRLAPLLPTDEARLAFLAVNRDGGRPRRVAVRQGPEVACLMEVCRYGAHPWTQVRMRLAERLDCAPSRAEQVMGAALRSGLLVPALAVDEQQPGFLTACAAAIAPDDPRRALVADLAVMADRLACDDATTRPEAMEQLRSAMARLPHAAAVGMQVYEDTLASSPPPPRPRTALAAMAELLPALSVFDLKTDLRLALQAVTRRAGGRVPLLEQAERLAAEAARLVTAASGGQPEIDDAEIRKAFEELWDVRRAVLTDLADCFGRVGNATEARLDEDTVRRWNRSVPAWARCDTASYGVMMQHGDGLWVCNNIYGGLGATYARFLHLDASAGRATAHLRARLRNHFGAGVAEDRHAHGFNTGVHPRLLDEVMGPQDWADATLVDEKGPGRLRLETRRALRPVVVTSTRWDLLAAPSRIALWLQGGGLISCAFDQFHRAARRSDASGGVLAVPRLRYRDVVLQRRRWYLPDLTPLTDAARGAEPDLRRLAETMARHGMPRQLFCKDLPPWHDEENPVPDLTVRPAALTKPQYVDTASALTLRSLAKTAREFTRPFVEECQPVPVEGRHVREITYEFDASAAPGQERAARC